MLHAGTKNIKGKILSNGGRVLNIVGRGSSYIQIREKIIKFIKKINWKNGFLEKISVGELLKK